MSNKEQNKGIRNVLPNVGIWTVEDLAIYLEIDSPSLVEALEAYNVPIAAITNRYKHKLIRMEDITAIIGKGKHAVQDLKQNPLSTSKT